MSDRIPIRFDRALRPEWLDFALEQSVRLPDTTGQRQALREYLSSQIVGKEALDKTITQLQRIVGLTSPVTREQLCTFHARMSQLSPDERTSIRLSLLMQASPFFVDCVTAARKLGLLSSNGFTTSQFIERIVASYGDRAVVPRATQRVLQTLAYLGAITSKDRRWMITQVIEANRTLS